MIKVSNNMAPKVCSKEGLIIKAIYVEVCKCVPWLNNMIEIKVHAYNEKYGRGLACDLLQYMFSFMHDDMYTSLYTFPCK